MYCVCLYCIKLRSTIALQVPYIKLYHCGAVYMVSPHDLLSSAPAARPSEPVLHSSDVGSSCCSALPVRSTTFFSTFVAPPSDQGLTLVHYSPHRKYILWDPLGA